MRNRVLKALLCSMLIVLMAALTRFFQIGQDSVWLDEAESLWWSAIASRLGWTQGIFFERFPEFHPPLYYWLLYLWRTLFGDGEVAIRSLSALASVLLIVIFYFLARRRYGLPIALATALLLSLHPVVLYYAQEARMYALMSLLLLLSSYAFSVWIDKAGRWPYLLLYILSTTALLYTHYLSFLAVALQWALGIWWATRVPKECFRAPLRLLVAWMGVGLAYVPWIPNLWERLQIGSPAWMTPPTWEDGVRVLRALMGIFYPDWDPRLGNPLSAFPAAVDVLAIGAAILVITGMIRLALRSDRFSQLVALYSLIPVLMFVLSLISEPIFTVRQTSPYVPFLMLSLANGVYAPVELFLKARRSGKWSRRIGSAVGPLLLLLLAALAMGLVYANGANTLTQYRYELKSNWRKAASDLRVLPPQALVLVYPGYFAEPLQYYYKEQTEIVRLPLLSNPTRLQATLKDALTSCPSAVALVIKSSPKDRKTLIKILAAPPLAAWNASDIWIYLFGPAPGCPVTSL